MPNIVKMIPTISLKENSSFEKTFIFSKELLVDHLPLRFNEWGLAVWKDQKLSLTNPAGPLPVADFIFLGFLLGGENDDRDVLVDRWPGTMSGIVLQAW